MKKYKNIVAILSLFGLMACEGNLEPEIYNRLSPDNFPQTDNDYSVLVTGIYGQFHYDNAWYRYSCDPYSRMILGELGTGELYIMWPWCNEPQTNFDFNPGYELFTQFYSKMVPSVTKATYALALLNRTKLSDEKLRQRYIAEVKAIRALWLYDLEGFYGAPPVVMDEEIAMNPDQMYFPPRLSADDFLAVVETDLKDAMKSLPLKYSSETDYGRFTKGAAASVLMKMYMRHKKFDKAIDMADSIMTYGYGLQSDYKSIWAINNKKNNELIFVLPAPSKSHTCANIYRAHVLPTDWVSPTGAKVVAYGGYRVPWSVYDLFDSKDTRLSTLVKDYYVKRNGEPTLVDGRRTGRLRQGALPLKYPEDPDSDGLFCGQDYVLIRYADILLLRAEALNELKGPNQESIDLINRVRDRAFNNDPAKRVTLAQFAGKEALNDYILQERQFELLMEGERREDLVRHGKYIEFANDRGITNAQSHHILYPLPSSAIIEGQGHIKQNLGYN